MFKTEAFIGQPFHLAVTEILRREFHALAPMIANNATIESDCHPFMDALVVKLRTWILAGRHDPEYRVVETPLSWWQHFKQDLMPKWIVRRWPVRYHTETITRYGNIYVCPHATEKWPHQKHFRWIVQTDIKPSDGN